MPTKTTSACCAASWIVEGSDADALPTDETTPITTPASIASLLIAPIDIPGSHGEPHVQDVALPHDVVLPFHSEEPLRLRGLHAAGGDEVVVGDDLRPDEAALEIRVDHAGRLRSLGAATDLPRARLVLPGREERDEVERPIPRRDDSLEARLRHPELLQQRAGLVLRHLRGLRLDRGPDGP